MRENRPEKIFKLLQRLLFPQTESVCFPIFQGVQKYCEETFWNQQHENTWEDVREEKKIHARLNTQSDFLKRATELRDHNKCCDHERPPTVCSGQWAMRRFVNMLESKSPSRVYHQQTIETVVGHVIFQIWLWSKKAFGFDLCFDLVWCTFSAWTLCLIWGCQSEAFH